MELRGIRLDPKLSFDPEERIIGPLNTSIGGIRRGQWDRRQLPYMGRAPAMGSTMAMSGPVNRDTSTEGKGKEKTEGFHLRSCAGDHHGKGGGFAEELGGNFLGSDDFRIGNDQGLRQSGISFDLSSP